MPLQTAAARNGEPTGPPEPAKAVGMAGEFVSREFGCSFCSLIEREKVFTNCLA
jgi:hypothetical protein